MSVFCIISINPNIVKDESFSSSLIEGPKKTKQRPNIYICYNNLLQGEVMVLNSIIYYHCCTIIFFIVAITNITHTIYMVYGILYYRTTVCVSVSKFLGHLLKNHPLSLIFTMYKNTKWNVRTCNSHQ